MNAILPRRCFFKYAVLYLLFFCVFNLFIAVPYAFSQTKEDSNQLFSFAFNKANKYRIEVFNVQNVFNNGKLIDFNVEIENRILVNVIKRGDEGILLDYSIETIETGHLISEHYSVFHQKADGSMVVPQKHLVPIVRNIPRFPHTPVYPQSTWILDGEEVFISPDTGQQELLIVPVEYTYMGYADIPQEIYEKITDTTIVRLSRAPYIKASYEVKNQKLVGNDGTNDQILNSRFDIEIWWNVEDGRVECYRENFDIRITTGDDTMQFLGSDVGVMIPVKTLNKEINEMISSIETIFPNVKVNNKEKGISFTIENIQFKANSADLTYEEKAKLETIAKILDLYKGRRILVEGHTALAGTREQRKELSRERAQTVVNMLQQFTVSKNLQFSFRGLGAEFPIDTNYTAAGRARNRRVEITILEN